MARIVYPGVWVADTRYVIDELTKISAGGETAAAESAGLFRE